MHVALLADLDAVLGASCYQVVDGVIEGVRTGGLGCDL